MDDNKDLLDRTPEIVAALKRACHDCNPTPCCEYEALGKDAADLIEAQADANKELSLKLRISQQAEQAKIEENERLKNEAFVLRCRVEHTDEAIAAVTAERDAASRLLNDLWKMLDPDGLEGGYSKAATNMVAYLIYDKIRDYQHMRIPSWRGPQGAGEGGT